MICKKSYNTLTCIHKCKSSMLNSRFRNSGTSYKEIPQTWYSSYIPKESIKADDQTIPYLPATMVKLTK